MNLSRKHVLQVALCSLLLALQGQSQTSEPQISGRVVRRDNGAPIEGATIALMPSFIPGNGRLQTAATNSNGEFQFQTVQEGVFTIRATADGFVPEAYRPDSSVRSEFQSVTAGSILRNIDFRLSRESVISGVVTKLTGEPVEAGVEVAAVRRDKREDGTERLLPVAGSKTDAKGLFVLKQLPSGTYLVCVNGPNGYNAFPVKGIWYRETWYGDVQSPADAVPVSLREGDEKQNLKIKVVPERRYHLTVWPSGPVGVPQPNRYEVTIMGRSHQSSGQQDGSYVIPDIPSGQYTLVTTAWLDTKYVGQSDTLFDVIDTDVVLRVMVGGLGQISGVATFEKAAAIPLGLKIKITSEGAAQAIELDTEGRFSFNRVLPGRYVFSLIPGRDGAMLTGARCGGLSVTADAPLIVGDRETVTGCELNIGIDPKVR